MSWRSDEQRAAVARALLALMRRAGLWEEAGPTPEPVA